ncbi:MAG: T9SS type A sorting domain-containing protein, partial [Flavobacteriales bacterium]|nr:T9SS type A sorting domain-containing protein [Flavobacteriales bacterium]
DHRPTLRPNPATDRIEVVPSALYGTVRGELIDPQGRTIKTFTSVGNATLDLGGIPSGVYQVRLVQDGTVQHGRFVKQ